MPINLPQKPISKKEQLEIAKKFMEQLSSHDTHTRKQVGGCVYCVDCNKRLYQGWL